MNRVEEQQLIDNNTNLGSHAGDDHLDYDKGAQDDERKNHSREFTAARSTLLKLHYCT
jgi:hypothetical protein